MAGVNGTGMVDSDPVLIGRYESVVQIVATQPRIVIRLATIQTAVVPDGIKTATVVKNRDSA